MAMVSWASNTLWLTTLNLNRNLSSQISAVAHAEAMKRMEVYKSWFDKTVMESDKRNTMILIPIEEIAPRYRDEMPKKNFNPVGVPNLFLSPILKAPELTVPSAYSPAVLVIPIHTLITFSR